MVAQIIPFAALGKLRFQFIIFILVMILLLGSSVIYGELASQMNLILTVYAVMHLYAMVLFQKTEHPPQTIIGSLPLFLIAFLFTLMIMLAVSPYIQGVLVASTLEAGIEFIVAFGVMHAFVKAYIEEEVFRARLSVILGEVGQAIAFGLFHFFVLLMLFGFSPMLLAAIVWLTLLGYIWGRVEDRGGIAASTGSHFGYNMIVMGMAAFIVGGAVI